MDVRSLSSGRLLVRVEPSWPGGSRVLRHYAWLMLYAVNLGNGDEAFKSLVAA